MTEGNLVGIGLYTPVEAQRLIGVPAGKISRWLRGHTIKGKQYKPLWQSQIDLDDERVYLGFRDLMEMRTAHAFMKAGVSAMMIRNAIMVARSLVDDDHPLSTTKFKWTSSHSSSGSASHASDRCPMDRVSCTRRR